MFLRVDSNTAGSPAPPCGGSIVPLRGAYCIGPTHTGVAERPCKLMVRSHLPLTTWDRRFVGSDLCSGHKLTDWRAQEPVKIRTV